MAKPQTLTDPQEIPTTFPPGTLFIARETTNQVYAGDDGGPQKGGKGRWKVGEVGQWTARTAPPLAHRDPEDGMIWKGWLEVVEQDATGPQVGKTADNRAIFGRAKQIFSEPMAFEQRSADRAKKEGKMTPKAKVPGPRATRRASEGAPQMADALKTAGQRLAVQSAGLIPVDPELPPRG